MGMNWLSVMHLLTCLNALFTQVLIGISFISRDIVYTVAQDESQQSSLVLAVI